MWNTSEIVAEHLKRNWYCVEINRMSAAWHQNIFLESPATFDERVKWIHWFEPNIHIHMFIGSFSFAIFFFLQTFFLFLCHSFRYVTLLFLFVFFFSLIFFVAFISPLPFNDPIRSTPSNGSALCASSETIIYISLRMSCSFRDEKATFIEDVLTSM